MSEASKSKANQTEHILLEGKSYGNRPMKPITNIAPAPSKVQQQPKNNSAESKGNK